MMRFLALAGKMRRATFACCLLAALPVWAQDGDYLPTLEEVYGGRVIHISPAALTDSLTRLYVATESANSVFYGDVDHARPAPFSRENFRFQVVPDMDAQANFGNVNDLAAHPASGRVFFSHDRGLFSCGIAPSSIVAVQTNSPMRGLLLRDNTLLGWGGVFALYWGTVDAAGDLTGWSGPLPTGFTQGMLVMAVHPDSGLVYLMDRDAGLIIKKSSDPYNALSLATTFSEIAVTNLVAGWSSRAFAIAPDGRLFVGGDDAGWKKLVYSDDDGATWNLVETGIGGGVGVMEFAGGAADYMVIAGSALSTNRGLAGSWTTLPRPGGTRETNPNDGPAAADPNNPAVFYFTTDLGIGTTTNAGADIFDIEEGLAAVQINDFDMTDDKYVAWSASKSGVHRAQGFPDAPVWSRAMFPMDNGAPYYAVAVDRADVTGATAFAANNNIYKTVDGGENWTLCYQVVEWKPYYISSLAVAGEMVMAGAYMNRQHAPDDLGWLMISTNAGNSFENYVIPGETNGLNVNDILLTVEDGQPVAYVAAEYDASGVSQNGAGHIYRLVMGGTDTKIELAEEPVSVRKFAVDPAGGIYASGMLTNHAPVLFYKAADSATWAPLPTDGLPVDVRPQSNPNWRGPVVTVGFDSESNSVPITVAQVQLYYLPAGGAKWHTSASLAYPNGTQINVLYWDDLMVGTDSGLFAQPTNLDPVSELAGIAGDFNGDGRTDLLAVDDQGQAYVWWARQDYQTVQGPFPLGVVGRPAAADFDGDGQDDLLMVDAQQRAYVWYSLQSYAAPVGPMALGVAGNPVAGDFDGDGLADLVLVSDAGQAYVWYSLENYMQRHGPISLGLQGAPAAGDLDGDGLADLIITDAQGGVTVWLSSEYYAAPYHLCPLDWGMTGNVVAGDLDGDGLADLLDWQDGGSIYVRFARDRWSVRDGPYQLPMPE